MGSDKEKVLDELYHTIDTLDELMMRDWMRKHIYGVAHWEKVRDLRQGLFLARCSRCHRQYKIGIKKWWNFCPYCGSYMKGE